MKLIHLLSGIIFMMVSSCVEQPQNIEEIGNLSDSAKIANENGVILFDTTVYMYTILGKSAVMKNRIDSISFCKRSDFDDEYNYVVANKTSGEFLCLTRSSLNSGNQISTMTFGRINTLDIPCKVEYNDIPRLYSNDSVVLGMSRDDIVLRFGNKYDSSVCDTCNYYSLTLYYYYSEEEYPSVVKEYNMPAYMRQFWFGVDGDLVKYSFGFPHP